MKKIKILCVALCLILLIGAQPASATQIVETTDPTQQTEPSFQTGAGDSSVSNGCHSLNAMSPPLLNPHLLTSRTGREACWALAKSL